MRRSIDLAVWVIAFIMLLVVFGFTYLGYRGGYPHRYAYEAFGVDLILLLSLIYGLYVIIKPSRAR
ncbi:hypothetical protein [Caldivirga sp. UBA161]|uniref:hypothetical protein n=1 Tax=Caldivirga sp. UBA161 TaxID=1915569 RepID=UPI0025C5DB58|nr:hypothetical protein [Caldivirga sp. UBA161]